MLGHHLQIETRARQIVGCFGDTYDAARADAVVHGAPCLALPDPLSVLPRLGSDMPLHLRTRLACSQRSHSDEITLCTSPTFCP
jgi:hypothetical protein